MERYQIPEIEHAHMENSRIPFAIYQLVDKRVVTLVLTRGFLSVFGYTEFEKAYYDMDNDMYRATHPDDAARIADAAYKFATEGGKYDVVYRTRCGEGYRIIHAQGEHFYTEDGVRLAQVLYTDEGMYDESKEDPANLLDRTLKAAILEDSFIKASYYDHLTGLPSMTYFFELATIKRKEIANGCGHPALLYMDFSGMKYFNHKYGFSEGDKLLQAFARVIAKRFGNENCSRLGQDHFAVITCATDLEKKLNELFKETAEINEGRNLPVHVGIFLQWYEGIVASMACDRAKFACDTLSGEYSSGYSFYNLSMKDTEEKQQYIIANVDKAIEEGWIKVYYQPIVRAVNGRVCDEEALARWVDPVKGFMSPGDFIPILEDHRLIYKLDLHIVDCVLEKIKLMRDKGFHIKPQSVNLSRSDFDTCDIVEEIRRRVDDAGISRSMLTIEITESIIGRDFDFIKKQIERFRELGFAVWMDDFGSGYSSLDLLQNVKFDLIKFDMRFMQQFNSGTRGRVILTELLKMATSLGIDTVCEGVETREQAQFLQETGCTKLQGYYFEKPIPVEKILEKYSKGLQIGFEDPAELPYHEAIGRVNLHDLSVIAQEDLGQFDNFFNTLPMAIIEINNGQVRFARSNQSYRDFMLRHFGFSVSDRTESFHDRPDAQASPFMKGLIKASRESGNLYVDEALSTGATVHSCMRRIAENPVTGTVAIAVAVLSISDTSQVVTYENIAMALAADYFNLFYVDIESEQFYEYTSEVGGDDMKMRRRGDKFFQACMEDAPKYLYHEDVEMFLAEFTKKKVLEQLDDHGYFALTYRLVVNGEPTYVTMKVMRMPNDPYHLIFGVSNVDTLIKQKLALDRMRQAEGLFTKLLALSEDYFCLYVVDPETNAFVEYASREEYKRFGLRDQGSDIFIQVGQVSVGLIYHEDMERFSKALTKRSMLETIHTKGVFSENYRLVYNGKLVPVTLRATLVKEGEGEKLLIGVHRRRETEPGD